MKAEEEEEEEEGIIIRERTNRVDMAAIVRFVSEV